MSKIDNLNMFHILADNVEQLNHGVTLLSQNEIQSKTLVSFLDSHGDFFYGFAYNNGSNVRVICWDENEEGRINKTVPKGNYVLAFLQQTTQKRFKEEFVADDFNIPWLDDDARHIIQEELIALIDKQDRLDDVVDSLARLTTDD